MIVVDGANEKHLVEQKVLLDMYRSLAMDRTNQVDRQRIDQMDRRINDNDELERMPSLLRKRFRKSQLNCFLTMNECRWMTPIYMGTNIMN